MCLFVDVFVRAFVVVVVGGGCVVVVVCVCL